MSTLKKVEILICMNEYSTMREDHVCFSLRILQVSISTANKDKTIVLSSREVITVLDTTGRH